MKVAYMDRTINLGEYEAAPDDDVIICRCEEITKGDIRQAIHDGMYTMTELRRFLRTGMGLCQGQICGRLVKNILQAELNRTVPADEATAGAPMRPIAMEVYGKEREE